MSKPCLPAVVPALLLPALLLSAAPALAQDATYATKADIAAAIAKAAATIKPDQPALSQPILTLGTWRANLEYRQAAAPAAVHPDQIEMIQVVEGSGTLVSGGTLDKSGPRGAVVVGGTPHHLAAGDTFIVPEGVPHWFNQIDGHLALITTKIPHAAGQ